jgi:hypothetical protein
VADTSYIIDISAQLDEGASAKQLDTLADKLSTGGRQAQAFEDALTQLRGQLDAASQASAEANAALGKGKAEYAGLEQAAVQAARGAERAELKRAEAIEKAQAAVARGARNAQARLAKAQDTSSVDAARAAATRAKSALDAYGGTLRKLERDAEQAADAQKRLSRTMGNAQKLTKRATDRLGDAATKLSTFRGALGDIGGPLGELGERALFPVQAFVDLNEWFGTATATGVVLGVGLAAIAAALVALAAVAAAASVAFAALAIKLADVARNARLTAEAFNAAYPEVAAVSEGFAELTRETGVAAEELRGLTRQLDDAKVSAADMPAALRSVALAEAALGKGQGIAYFNEQLKAAKGNVSAVAFETERKFGDIVARQMLGLEAQGQRLKSNLGGLFADLDIEGALKGLRTLVALFDENTVAGKVLKAVLKGVLQPIIDQAQTAAWAVEAFFLGLAIGALKVYIGLKPVIDRVSELLGLDFEGWDLETVLRAIAKAGEYAAPFLMGVAAGVTLIGTVLVATTALALAPLAALVAAITALGYALVQMAKTAKVTGVVLLTAVKSAVDAALGALRDAIAKVAQVGGDIMAGLAKGITGSAGKVVSAMSGAVGGAIAAAKRQLGIASPSKVFAEIGGYTGEGFVKGVDSSAPAANDAVANLASPEPARAAAASGGATVTTNNNRGPLVVIENLTLGAGSTPQQAQDFVELVTRLIEGDATALAGAAA